MDDAEWERWLSLTVVQQEAEIAAAERDYMRWWNSMTAAQQFRHRRRSWLDLCKRWRGHIRRDFVPEVATEHLRHAQIALVKLRYERRTGIYPGDA
jgi:hypothetical protein